MSQPPLTYPDLATIEITRLRGVSPQVAARLAQLDPPLEHVLDLLLHLPRRHLDRTRSARIAELMPDDEAVVVATVKRVSSRKLGGRRSMVNVEVGDGSGTLSLTFFNQPWREKQLPVGTEVYLFGKVTLYQGRRQMAAPLVDLIGNRTGKVIPLYPQSEKLRINSDDLANWVDNALSRCSERGLADPVPVPIVERLGLIDRETALRNYHQPTSMEDLEPARRRLVFDELFRIQVALVAHKRALERMAKGIIHVTEGPLLDRFRSSLPFPLTGAQERCIGEIRADLAGVHPTHRLLQGDVGAGKTLVALDALLVAVQGGHQGALMAPTEVLAEQHKLGLDRMLEGLLVPSTATLTGDRPLDVRLLTGRTPAAERRRILAGLASGEVDICVGTHALIEDAVQFASLGVVVVDEQHRFGVEQRNRLRGRGQGASDPDVLVMTATPIPRTAAMTVYGDLDVSVLDELPPGRTPITTEWVRGDADLPWMWAAVRAQVAEGRQAYVVCPLVEESEKLEAASAAETFESLSFGELSELRLELLHGRMSGADKEAAMSRFRAREADVLVATTVIEVGVDVPNATVMVILDADRFGIAQLHQLRGRVGRGGGASWCYLVSASDTADAEARLGALCQTTDGFALAEVDLELRGEGTIMDTMQSGRRGDLRLASLQRDGIWVQRAREAAFEVVDGLGVSDALVDEISLLIAAERRAFLFKS